MGYFTHVFKWGIPWGFFTRIIRSPCPQGLELTSQSWNIRRSGFGAPAYGKSRWFWHPTKARGIFRTLKNGWEDVGFPYVFPSKTTGKDIKKLQERRTINKTHQNNLTRSSYHQKSNFQDLKPVFYNKHVCPKRRSNMNQ